MHATQPKSRPTPSANVRREQGAKTDLDQTPVRPTVTVWIGNTSYQAVLV